MTPQTDIAIFLVAFIATLAALAAALAPIIVAATELAKVTFKGAFKTAIPSELVPALACLIGIGLAVAIMGWQPGLDWRAILIGGFLGGLRASKLFDDGQARAESPPGTREAT